ncbi:MAG: rhodanese-like domain-containing protein [Firmicutes bacterium]|nr:rhodanese-like domain-containing protein [Bacillota bacterium]
MKRIICALIAGILVPLLCACGQAGKNETEAGYMSITAEEAKERMDEEADYIILDVRTEEEYAAGHIPGAVLLPDYEVSKKAESLLPDKAQLILVYCRSGRRSKLAAETLAALGYTNVKEFGGIIDWPYEVETD